LEAVFKLEAVWTNLSKVATEVMLVRKRALRAVSFIIPLGIEGHCVEEERAKQAAWP
jgi:hypothetical protein